MKCKWIPSLCTVCNLGAGAVSLLYTIQGHYRIALILIAFAAFFDVLDGLLARLMHCTSEFGKQLDSLADLISFGAAPAFLILLNNLDDIPQLGAVMSIIFLICGALRLARFNITVSSPTFTGMPITAAGTILALMSLLSQHIQPFVIVTLMGVLSLLMISRVPFPSLKNITTRK